VAVIDGLGHGDQARESADAAARTIRANADEPVMNILKLCHERLRGTRGAVIGAAAYDRRDNSITWSGIGNVLGVLLRANGRRVDRVDHILQRGGLLGYQLPHLAAEVHALSPGDTLILTTDGVAPLFYQDIRLADSPEKIAKRIIERYATSDDDALVLVAKYIGAGHEL